MKRMIGLIIVLTLVLSTIPSFVFGEDLSNTIDLGKVSASINKGTITECIDADIPESYGSTVYSNAWVKDIVIDSLDNDSFELEFSYVAGMPSTSTLFGEFPKFTSIGYTKSETDKNANAGNDTYKGYYVKAAKLLEMCDDANQHAGKFSVTISNGKGKLVVFFSENEKIWKKKNQTPTVFILNFYTRQAYLESKLLQKIETVPNGLGQFEKEYNLYSGIKTSYLVVPKDTSEVPVKLTFGSSDLQISLNDDETLIDVPDTKELTVTLQAAFNSYNGLSKSSVNTIKIFENGELAGTYTINVIKQRFDDLPQEVVDYLCIGSQYTNVDDIYDYGLRAVRSVVGSNITMGDGSSGPVSLGNYGGYIVYRYDVPIMDDPHNPYGVDFITYGNAYIGTQEFGEPGQVWVSEDGLRWYSLAGGMHYEDYADWNYTVTYSKTETGLTKAVDSKGNVSDLEFEYPDPIKYPLHTFSDEELSSITLKGIFFDSSKETNEYGNILAPYAGFGYVDLGSEGTKLFNEDPSSWMTDSESGASLTEIGYEKLARNIAKNPYLGDYSDNYPSNYDVPTGGMDLSWAVDSNGQPVALKNGIRYIKIATASNIINNSLGEKSTEVNMVRVAQAADSVVGVSDAPASISFDGVKVNFTSGAAISNNVFTFEGIAVDGAFTVEVDAKGSNVYINNNCATSVDYETIPDHEIVRVIVQNDECEPLIYVFNLREMTDEEKADAAAAEAAKAVNEKIEAIGNVTLESAAEIKAARDAYEALDDAAKAKVEKLDKLIAAEAKLKELQEAASKEEADAAAAKGVSEAITALGDDISLDDEKAVESARAAYNALTDDQKALVTNEDALKAAEAKIAQLKEDTPKAQAVEKQIAAIGEVTKYKEEEIQSARIAYEALTDSQKALVGNLAVLEAAEKALEDLKSGSGSDDTIKVTFRLIGSTKSTQDVDLSKGEEGYYTAEYQNWIKTRTYTMHSDDSVYDLFVKATSDAGIESKGANKGYVSAVKAPDSLGGYWLEEFTNGKYSGWMYTMDGKHTNAIKDQKLKDGADVIFHYVNDYRYEVEDWFDEPAYPSLATDDTFYSRWLEAADVRPGSQGGGGTTPAEEPEVVDPVDTPEDPNGGATVGRFIDVDEDDWFAEAVDYAVENGFMVGTGEDTFSPQKTLTRGMLASMLYSMEGAPAEDGTTDFTDVDPSDWFAKGVEWAVENGVAAGYGERFGPNDDITREQMVVMLYGYAKMKGYELVEGEDLSGYEDAGEISSWALPAMQWAKAAGLVSGRSATKMAPLGTTTRAEAATIMRNFLENVAK